MGKRNNIDLNENMAKVVFNLEDSDWHNHATESVWAFSLGKNLYQLDNIPFYAYDVSLGDVVEAENINGELMFSSVKQRGGHSTYRIFLDENSSTNLFESFWKELENLGCSYEKGKNYLIAVDVPPEVDIYKAYEVLEKGEEAEIWDFEEGHCGHSVQT